MLSRIPLWVYYLAMIGALVAGAYFIPTSPTVPLDVVVKDSARATLDLLLETTKLVTALDTALVGAAAALAVKGTEWSSTWGRAECVLVLLCFLGASLSYFGVYLTQVAVLAMVYQGGLYLFEARLYFGFRLQFYGMLGGVVCLGIVFIRMLEGRIIGGARLKH